MFHPLAVTDTLQGHDTRRARACATRRTDATATRGMGGGTAGAALSQWTEQAVDAGGRKARDSRRRTMCNWRWEAAWGVGGNRQHGVVVATKRRRRRLLAAMGRWEAAKGRRWAAIGIIG